MGSYSQRAKSGSEGGFGFLELIVVIAIVGISFALMMTKYKTFRARNHQAQAKGNLSHMFQLQEAYFKDQGRYATIAETGARLNSPEDCTNTENVIGFTVLPCGESTKYAYSAVVTNDGSGFIGIAISGIGSNNRVMPGCEIADRWTVNERHVIKNDISAVKDCP